MKKMHNRTMSAARPRRLPARLALPALALLTLLLAAACSSVFTGTVSGTVYDAATYNEDDPVTLGGIEVYLYEAEADRDSDYDALTDASGTEPSLAYDSTTSAGDGTFSLNFVWNTLFPEYGDTGDREEVFLLFVDPTGEYAPGRQSATVISQYTADVIARLSAARARTTISGTVQDAVTGAGLGDVTVTGYLPASVEYDPDGGGLSNVTWSGGERAFRISTGDGGGYETSFTFPKQLDPDESGDERTKLRLLFSRTGYRVETDGDTDLSSGADVDGDGANDVYYQTPVILESVTTALDTISIKPTEFSVTVEGKVYREDGTDVGAPIDGTDAPADGETLVLSFTDPRSGDPKEYRTTSQQTGVGSDAENGVFTFDNVTWGDNSYNGTQSTVVASITVEGSTNVYVPSGGTVEILSGTQNYVEVLFD